MTKVVKSSAGTRVVSNKIRGVDVDVSRFRYNQSPVETPDGVTTEFTLPNSESYVSGLIEVYLNGNQQIKDTEWQEKSGDATKIEFIGTRASAPPESDESIKFNYIKQ